MSASSISRRTALGLLAAVIVLWGVNWPVMKLGLQHIAPLTFATVRMAMGMLCMTVFVGALGRLHRPSRRDWPIVLWIGGLQMAAFLGLVSVGLQYVEAGRSAILAYTTPLWVVPGAAVLLGERLTAPRLAGFLTGMLGVAVLFNPLTFDWGDRAGLFGNSLLMLAALVWAVAIVQIKRHRWDSAPLDLMPWQFLVATLVLAPFALALEAGRPIGWNWELAAILLYNGPIATAFCYIAAVLVNRALPAITTSLGLLGVPVAGLVSSALLLGEPVGLTEGIGLALIVAGLVLLTLGDRSAATDRAAPPPHA